MDKKLLSKIVLITSFFLVFTSIFICSVIWYGLDKGTTYPIITWDNPTPTDGDFISQDSVYLNTTIDTLNLSLEDDFNDNIWNITKTVESNNTDSNVTEINNRREHHCLVADVSAYYRTNQTYIPQNKSFIVQITQHANDGGFKLCPTDPEGYKWDVYSEADWYNFQLSSSNKISPNKKVDGGAITQIGGDCDIIAPYWLRIKVDTQKIYFDYVNNMSDYPEEEDWVTCSSENWEAGIGASDSVGQYAYVTNYDSNANGVLYSENLLILDKITKENTSAMFDWNNSLVGYWPMDYYNTSGVFDNSTYDNFGIFYNISVSNKTTGKYGDAFEFNGEGDYIDCGNNSELIIAGPITIETWINPKPKQEFCFNGSYGNYGVLGSADAAEGTSTWSYQLRYGSPTNCSLGFQLNTGLGGKWVDIGYNLTTGTWHHIVLVFNGSATKLYVNGVLTDTNNFGDTTIVTNIKNKFLLGVGGWGESNTYYNGSIDETKVWNRVLSQEEINASYNNQLYRLSNNFTSLSDGIYNYSAYAIDNSGDLEITSERVITIDTIIPQISIATPTNNTNSTDYGLPLEYIFSDTNVDSCWWTDDNGVVNTSFGGCGLNTTGPWVEGMNNVTVWINDSANNQNSSSVSFIIDNSFPKINITSPLNNSIHTLNYINISLNLTSTDNVGISAYKWSKDNGVTNTTFTTNQTWISWEVIAGATYDYTIMACVNDSANNINCSYHDIQIVVPLGGSGSGGGAEYTTTQEIVDIVEEAIDRIKAEENVFKLIYAFFGAIFIIFINIFERIGLRIEPSNYLRGFFIFIALIGLLVIIIWKKNGRDRIKKWKERYNKRIKEKKEAEEGW